MATRQKISQMPPKGANLDATDLLEISELSGSGYITKSITGQEIIDGVLASAVTDVTGTLPISSSGGSTPVISIADAVADGTTKGAPSFTASDFNATSGNISIDYTNGQAASGSVKGFLTSTDWTTFNNKASYTPRVHTVASAATVTPTSTNDLVTITAQAAALALANPTGTWDEGQPLIIRIKDNGTARAITYGTDYRAIGITLPTTTVLSKTTYIGLIYNDADTKWDAIGVTTQA